MGKRAEGKGRGGGVHGHREGKIEGVARRYVCEQRAHGIRTCVFVCGGRVKSGSESGARTGANWSRLVCPISVQSAPPPFTPLGRSIALSTPLAVAPYRRAPRLSRQLANLPTRVPFRNY